MPRFRAAVMVLALLGSPALALADDVVLRWNNLTTKTLVQYRQTVCAGALCGDRPARRLRAVNAITGDYEPYIGITAPAGASPDAAAATAAYRVLKTYFPAAPDIDRLTRFR